MIGSIISLVCVIGALVMVKNWKFDIYGLLVWVGAEIIWVSGMFISTPGSLYKYPCMLNVILIGILLFKILLRGME